MLLLPLKKVTAPAPWAAAEPETTGKGLRPCQFYAAVKLPTKSKNQKVQKTAILP